MRKTVLFAVAILAVGSAAMAADNFEARVAEGNGHQCVVFPSLGHPGQVHTFEITCNGAEAIRVRTNDCCIPGDHWLSRLSMRDPIQAKQGIGDPDPAGPGTFFKLEAHDIDPMRALLQVRYHDGTNLFPAGGTVVVSCLPHTASCSVIDNGATADLTQ